MELISKEELLKIVNRMDDLISRQTAINVAIEAVDEWDGGFNITRADMIKDAINNITPSAQPEQKKGKWIGTGYDGYANGNPVYDEWECSNCGHEIKTEDTPPYCEMCGTYMRGE